MRATYSPEDNKLRFYPVPDTRLSEEDYLKFKNLGFRWAFKQKLFVAPMWTPSRYDFLVNYVGNVEPEEITLKERAEQRAERFEGYHENRLKDAHHYKDVAQELGSEQLLIGHHSQEKAEKQAKKAENAMQKAVDNWETSKYWTYRTAGVISNVTYKDKAEVRFRRIKKLGADMRKFERATKEYESRLNLWSAPNLSLERARAISNSYNMTLPKREGEPNTTSSYDALHKDTYPNNYYGDRYAPRSLEEIIAYAKTIYPNGIKYNSRWIQHYQNRINYETEVLKAQGGGYLLAPVVRPKQLPLLNISHELSTKTPYDREPVIRPLARLTKDEYRALYNKHTEKSTCGLYRQKVATICEEGEPRWKSKWHAIFLTDAKEHKKPEEPEED